MPTILTLVPHPDDEAYSVAGTLALAAAAGWHCVVVAVTAGEGGLCHNGRARTPAALGRLRLAELASACAALGAHAAPSPRFPDGGLAESRALAPAIQSLLDRHQPDILVTLGPDGAYGHPDHLALHRTICHVVEALPAPPALLFAAFPAGLFIPQYERCRPILGSPPAIEPAAIGITTPDFRVPIASVARAKLEAIGAHQSQLPGGDPEALFPRGIVSALLSEEWFLLHRPADMARVARLLFALEPFLPGTSASPPASPGA